MLKRKLLIQTNLLFITAILLVSCSLTGEQESRLNKQLSNYIQSYNENNTLVYAGLTHPVVVRYYQSISDSTFLQQFKTRSDTAISYLSNPIYETTQIEGNWMERKYRVTKSNNLNENHHCQLIAISDDGGENWFFVLEDDYFNPNIPLSKHLFTK